MRDVPVRRRRRHMVMMSSNARCAYELAVSVEQFNSDFVLVSSIHTAPQRLMTMQRDCCWTRQQLQQQLQKSLDNRSFVLRLRWTNETQSTRPLSFCVCSTITIFDTLFLAVRFCFSSSINCLVPGYARYIKQAFRICRLFSARYSFTHSVVHRPINVRLGPLAISTCIK